MPSGILATLPNLQAVVDSIPADAPWLVMCWNGDVMKLAAFGQSPLADTSALDWETIPISALVSRTTAS